jgi:hypothetical protein
MESPKTKVVAYHKSIWGSVGIASSRLTLTIAGGEWSALQLGKGTPYPLNGSEHFVYRLQDSDLGVKDVANLSSSSGHN